MAGINPKKIRLFFYLALYNPFWLLIMRVTAKFTTPILLYMHTFGTFWKVTAPAKLPLKHFHSFFL